MFSDVTSEEMNLNEVKIHRLDRDIIAPLQKSMRYSLRNMLSVNCLVT